MGTVIEQFDLSNSYGYGNVEYKKLSAVQAIKWFCHCTCYGGHHYDWRMADGKLEKASMPNDEVRACKDVSCPLYPFRTGRDPNRAHHKGNEEALRLASEKRSRTARKR